MSYALVTLIGPDSGGNNVVGVYRIDGPSSNTAVAGPLVFMTQAGPVPHLPENGEVVAFGPWGNVVWEVASGAPLLVDLEVGRHFDLFVFALAQGTWNGPREGTPALPFTSSLVEARLDGTFRVIAGGGGSTYRRRWRSSATRPTS